MEQPTLLDPHLQDMVRALMRSVRKDHPKIHRSCRLIYLLCTIRGHKTVGERLLVSLTVMDPNLAFLWFRLIFNQISTFRF